MVWEINSMGKVPKLDDAILIEGLPGIGNVGKLTVDFLIDELKAKKIYEFFSYSLPHSVFVNEDNLVNLPTIEMYYAIVNSKPLLFLSGDTQPIDEISSYQFSNEVIELAQKLGASEIITIGGIGLSTAPEHPKVYCTGNCKDIVSKYKKGTQMNDKLYGVVGPIIGVSGLLIGLSKKRNMKALSLLAETYGHPMYMGFNGAKEVISVLNAKLGLKVNPQKLDKELEKLEQDGCIERDSSEEVEIKREEKKNDSNYIG
jgi:uncharacterized protein